jgi:hypothetical protein
MTSPRTLAAQIREQRPISMSGESLAYGEMCQQQHPYLVAFRITLAT